jgi:hypothetical protein
MGRVDVNPFVIEHGTVKAGVIQLGIGLRHDREAMDDATAETRYFCIAGCQANLSRDQATSSSLPQVRRV